MRRHLIAEIGHFFDIYKELEPGKSTDVRGWQDRAARPSRDRRLVRSQSRRRQAPAKCSPFGIGPRARVSAMSAADGLRAMNIAAAALFKPSMGGWIVQIFPGGIRQRPVGRRP